MGDESPLPGLENQLEPLTQVGPFLSFISVFRRDPKRFSVRIRIRDPVSLNFVSGSYVLFYSVTVKMAKNSKPVFDEEQ